MQKKQEKSPYISQSLTSGYNILEVDVFPHTFFGFHKDSPPQTDPKTFSEVLRVEDLWSCISPSEVDGVDGISPVVKILSKRNKTFIVPLYCNHLLPNEQIISVPPDFLYELTGYSHTDHLKTSTWIPKTKSEVRSLVIEQAYLKYSP